MIGTFLFILSIALLVVGVAYAAIARRAPDTAVPSHWLRAQELASRIVEHQEPQEPAERINALAQEFRGLNIRDEQEALRIYSELSKLEMTIALGIRCTVPSEFEQRRIRHL